MNAFFRKCYIVDDCHRYSVNSVASHRRYIPKIENYFTNLPAKIMFARVERILYENCMYAKNLSACVYNKTLFSQFWHCNFVYAIKNLFFFCRLHKIKYYNA